LNLIEIGDVLIQIFCWRSNQIVFTY